MKTNLLPVIFIGSRKDLNYGQTGQIEKSKFNFNGTVDFWPDGSKEKISIKKEEIYFTI